MRQAYGREGLRRAAACGSDQDQHATYTSLLSPPDAQAGSADQTAYRDGGRFSVSDGRPRGLQPRAPDLCCSARRTDLLPGCAASGGGLGWFGGSPPSSLFQSSSGSHLTAGCNRRAVAATEGAGLSCEASGQAVTSCRVIRRAPIRSGRTIQMASEVPACAHWVALMTYSVIWPRARA